MYQSPKNFDFESNDELNYQNSSPELIDNNDLNHLSTKNLVQRKKHLEKLFVYLIGFGVGLGLVLTLIVVMALNKFGLLEKPYQIESQPQSEPTEILELDS